MPIFLSEEFDDELLSEDLVLTEGTKYDKKAAKILSDSGLFNEEESQNIINDLFRNDIEAFVHAPAWLEKYLVCIANIIVKEADGDKEKAWQFIGDCPDTFNEFLKWVKEVRPTLRSDSDRVEFDKAFMEKAKFSAIEGIVADAQAERDAQSKDELARMKFEGSNYTLVPIESYDEFHSKYGGRATGDGESDLYAGGGGTAWCHANSKSTYDSSRWTGGGKRFFVLERKDWRDIPFNPTTNAEMAGKDDYGNSLIAILVSRTGNLLAATLRCNHVGVPKDADEQYKTYAELSKIAGFNVEDAVKEYIGDIESIDVSKCFKVENGVLNRNADMDIGIEDITSYEIPEGVTTIGYNAFARFVNLKSVTIPDSVKRIESGAFYNCKGLPSVTVGKGVTSIENGAFYGCTGLTTVTLYSGIESIGPGAFFGCTSLTSINLPESIKTIGDSAFQNCTALPSIAIPNGVSCVEESMFERCTNLHTVTLGESVKTIEDGVFRGCIGLPSVAIPDSVVSIGREVFYGCEGLTSVDLGEGITSIGGYAFGYCDKLPSVTIPDSVTSIGSCAFVKCYGLTSVTIGKGVTRIGARAFADCYKLTSVTIPDSVKSIGENAFLLCSRLSSVTIGNGVTSIGRSAFEGCVDLSSINFTGTKEQWEEISKGFYWDYYTSSLHTIHCTNGDIPKNTSESLSEGFYLAEGDEEFTEEELNSRAMDIDDDIEAYLEDLPYSSIKRYMDRVGGKVEEIDTHSPCFVDRYGEIYSVVKSSAGERGARATHDDFERAMMDIIYKESHLYDNPLDRACVEEEWVDTSYHVRMLQEAMDKVGIFRINTGTNAVEHRFYCVLPGVDDYRLNGSQIDVLNKFFWLAKELNKNGIIVFFGDDYQFQYRLRDDFSPDDLTEEVRKYYEGNKLHSRWDEDLDEDIDDLRRVLTEGTKYDKKAAKIISDSGLFDEDTSSKIIDALFRQDIHAFVHAPAWLEKYLVGIARMLVDEADGDRDKAIRFLETCPPVFNDFLTWVKETRPGLTDEGKAELDTNFNNKKPFQWVKDTVEEVQAERDEKSKQELADMEFGESNYTLVPIESFEDFKSKYGGSATGDGESDGFAGDGEGGTAWCHTNSESTYDNWTRDGQRFFVLERNDWRDIPFNPETNKEQMGKDDYGNSLIAIQVSKRGTLKAATLRGNHEGIPKDGDADRQYKTYAELSKVAGFNVEKEVKKYIGDVEEFDINKCFKVENGVLRRNYDMDFDPEEITSYAIPDGVTEIGNYAFQGCSGLTSVFIPNSVTSIGVLAFEDCSSLPLVTIPDSVTSIDSGAFSGCSGLTSVTIPDSVKGIGMSVFHGCSRLTSVSIGNGVTSIGRYVFGACTALPSITIPDNVSRIESSAFSKCEGLTSVDLGNGVTFVGNSAFSGCVNLRTVTIGDSVKTIDDYAFYDCHSLKSITIPDSVSRVGDYAFCGCTALSSIFIPNSVANIGNEVFSGCSGLTSVSIDNGVTRIGNEAFRFCTGLKAVTIPDSVTRIGDDAFFGCTGLTTVTIGDGVTRIGSSAFQQCSGLTSVTVGNSVTSIGNAAFYYCTGLSSINIPDSVTTIGSYAFYGCSNLTSVAIPNSVLSIGFSTFEECPNLTIKCEKGSRADEYVKLFKIPVQYTESLGASSDGRIELDESIDEEILTEGTRYDKQAAKIIADSGLYDLETSEKIIDALFHDDIHAFVHAPNWLEKYLKGIARMLVEEANGDKEMAKIFLSETPAIFDEYLTWVKENRDSAGGASFDIKFVTTLHYEDIEEFVRDLNSKRDAESKEKLASMEFGDSDYKLVPIESYEQMHERYGGKLTGDGSSDDYAGNGGTAWCHTNSESVYDDWTNAGRRFFVLEKNGWKDIPFDKETNKTLKGKDDYGNSLIAIRVSRKGDLINATLRCNHVGVDTNADNQYISYAELSEVVGFNVEEEVKKLLGDVEEIDVSKCFKVTPRGELYWNGEYAGSVGIDKSEIEECIIPDGVTSIGEDAFNMCSSLTSITIPDSVTRIGYRAFEDCFRLTSITLPDSVKNIGCTAFSGCFGLTSVDLGKGVTVIADEAFEWCKGLTSITIPESVTTIGPYAFYNCTGLTSITIPGSVMSIGHDAFHGCTDLSSVTIGKGVKNIGNFVFYGCSKLTSVTLPDSVESIGEYAFANCTGLTSVTVSNGVTSIEYSAFARCVNLTSITIPNSVTSIGDWVFDGCDFLTVQCERGSYAEKYCFVNNIAVRYIDTNTSENEGITLTEEREEDIASFEDKFGKGSFERFNRLKGRMKNAGIPVDIVFHTKNTDPVTMRQFLDDAENRVVKDVQTGETKLNRKLVAENDHYTVWDVLDWETAMNMGDGTSWCIAGRYDTNEVKPSQAKKYFNEYKNERGVKAFLFFMPKGNEEKYCMVIYPHLTYQFWDSSDSSSRMNTPPVSTFKSRVPIPEIDYMGVNVQYPEERAGLIFSGTRSVIGFTDDLDLDNAVIPEGVQAIAKEAFRKSSIKKVTLPESLLEICAGAFQECDKLREIQVPSRCVFIGTLAFGGCSSIKRVDLQESIRAIHSGAFMNCKSLKRIAIPSSVTTIEDNTFRGCSELREVILPEGLKSIEWGAFAHCPNLTKIRLHDLIVHIDHDAFYDHNPDLTIQCHKGTLGDEFAEQHHLKVEYVD